MDSENRVVTASAVINAAAHHIFDLIADPVQQPLWDGNDNLAEAVTTDRVTAVGDVFTILTTYGNVRDNLGVEFEEGRIIAWLPALHGHEPPGHLWRWEVEALSAEQTRVTHTYDWTNLTDEDRFERARATTADWLMASIRRLSALAEGHA